jgi:AcrR family transcriptional regulator
MTNSRETVMNAAITILNREGIEKLTMRALADELGIKAASLYNHFKDKQSLYNALSEKICAEMRPSCGLADAKGYLMENALLYRKGLLKVRDAVKILAASPPLTPIRAELTKNALLCLLRSGIKDENCIVAGRLFNNYVLSFVSDETAILDEGWAKANPYIAIFGVNYKPISNDEQFFRGLNALFAGFKTLE